MMTDIATKFQLACANLKVDGITCYKVEGKPTVQIDLVKKGPVILLNDIPDNNKPFSPRDFTIDEAGTGFTPVTKRNEKNQYLFEKAHQIRATLISYGISNADIHQNARPLEIASYV